MHTPTRNPVESRRTFLTKAALGSALLLGSPSASFANKDAVDTKLPWYRRTYRWGQTNITEADPARYDIEWWRGYWKQTRVQGVIINAGGIVAYYPSKYPLHYRPKSLSDRDLFGELTAAAHNDGLVVFARMDSNRAHEEFFTAHQDWFCRQSNGAPYKAGDQYITCINSDYYNAYLPQILREIAERSRPEGFTDNSWAGLGRGSICFCDNCRRSFRDKRGKSLPMAKNWDDPVYRDWIAWNYQRRLEIWDFNNKVTKAAAGPDCIWSGMNSGSISGQSTSFRDFREICCRAEIIMLDHQSRSDSAGFQENAQIGNLIHGLLGWDKLIPESMAMYQAGRPTFRVSSKPPIEAQMWMIEGIAGGIQPWWHHVGAYHEDRRMYRTAEPLMKWHETNERHLINRKPIADVGLVWSQRNTDFYGRDNADLLVEAAWRGWTNALLKARIPYLPVHSDDISSGHFKTLILPNVAAMSDKQLDSIRAFVAAGGNLVVSGETGYCNEFGEPRKDSEIGLLTGHHSNSTRPASVDSSRRTDFSATAHTYLRLSPELRSAVYGPRVGDEPRPGGQRHAVLNGFEETDILPFGGTLEAARVDADVSVLATFIPPFPIYPPETAWMRETKTQIPAITARTTTSGSRIVYFAADIDRRFSRDNLPDHGSLLENAARWANRDQFPFLISGHGMIDARLYSQPDCLILHLVNLTSPGTWRAPIDEIIPIGPLTITIQGEHHYRKVRLTVAQKSVRLTRANRALKIELPHLRDHEMMVFEV